MLYSQELQKTLFEESKKLLQDGVAENKDDAEKQEKLFSISL